MEKVEQLEQIKEAIKRDKSLGLSMNRVPQPTRDAFVELANKEFSGDYGLTLKYVFDIAMMYSPQIQQLQTLYIELEQRMNALEAGEESPKKERKTLSGKVIG